MGLSSSSVKNEPWKGSQPYLTSGGTAVQDAYNTNAGGIQNATNQVTSLLPGVIQKYQDGNPGINAAQGYNTDVLSGKYLDQGNPYLQQIIDKSNNDVRNQTQGALGVKGLTGGSDYANIISRNLAQNDTNLRYQDYTNERNAMSTASGQTPALAAADTLQINPMLSLLQAYQQPLNAAESYAGSLGSLFGAYQNKTSTPSIADSIGKGIQAVGSVASIFSDERLKEDIEPVGKTKGGLPIYTYKYKGDETPRMGVMAQDVKKKQPGALGPLVGRYMTVDYGKVR
jgi:hypothetical protein